MKKQQQKQNEKGNYVDGFVLVVPKNKTAEYKKMAQLGARTWKKHGALDYKECVVDDAKPKGILFNFPTMAKLKKNETVWFSYIVFKSKKHRDQVNAKVMKDPAMSGMSEMPMPVDMKRFAYGGFKVVVSI